MLVNCAILSCEIESVGGPHGVCDKSDVAPRMRWTCDGKGLFASGTTQPQQAAKTRQTSHPDKIVVSLSTARTSSTQCEVAKPAMVAKAWQHQSGTLAKFTGQDFPPKNCVRPTRNAGQRFCGCYCTITAKPAKLGSAGTCLYFFLKSLGN